MDRGNAISISIKDSNIAPGVKILEKGECEKNEEKKVRVAAYCRVSTKQELQASSLETQISSYKRIISEHPGWELAGIYADKGTTGTSVKNRKEFKRMIEDAENGKIDYIIAKSTSRFARNTLDTLEYTRKLKEMGVGVYFEEQKLDTNGIASELLLTIHASFAQEESRSISENNKKGNRARYAMGIPSWSPVFGFRRNEKGEWVLEPEEAKVIKEIFDLYINGMSITEIQKYLEDNERKSPNGTTKWYTHTLACLLRNEKYMGDVEMQKTYVKDHITHKRIVNNNMDLPKYYKENHHEPIVSRDEFMMANTILKMKDYHKGSSQYPFYGILKCPCCGENMVAVTLPARLRKRAWTCGGKSNGETEIRKRSECSPFSILDYYLHKGVKEALMSLDDEYLAGKNKSEAAALIDEKKKNWEKVEYVFLYKYVKTITFDMKNGSVDFNTLVVDWKFGKKTKVKINYERPSEIPVRRDEINLLEDEYIVRGVSTNGTNKAYTSVSRILDFLERIEVFDAEEYERTKVPRVVSPNSYQRKVW